MSYEIDFSFHRGKFIMFFWMCANEVSLWCVIVSFWNIQDYNIYDNFNAFLLISMIYLDDIAIVIRNLSFIIFD